MPTFIVDYNRIGRAKTARAALWPEHRGVVYPGMMVLVSGDDVLERKAMVESISPDGRYAYLRFQDILNQSA